MPGELLAVDAFPDVPAGGRVIRVVSLGLADRGSREVAAEVGAIARELGTQIMPLIEFLRDAAAPLVRAEQALLAYRPMLETRARAADAEVYPSKGGLGDYEGGKYLQVGSYWLCTAPASGNLLAESQRVNEPHIRTLAGRLGREVTRRVQLGCVVLTEEELRDPVRTVAEDIAEAFDVWFEARAENRAAAEAEMSTDGTE
jgi:hypothetical protein